MSALDAYALAGLIAIVYAAYLHSRIRRLERRLDGRDEMRQRWNQ